MQGGIAIVTILYHDLVNHTPKLCIYTKLVQNFLELTEFLGRVSPMYNMYEQMVLLLNLLRMLSDFVTSQLNNCDLFQFIAILHKLWPCLQPSHSGFPSQNYAEQLLEIGPSYQIASNVIFLTTAVRRMQYFEYKSPIQSFYEHLLYPCM